MIDDDRPFLDYMRAVLAPHVDELHLFESLAEFRAWHTDPKDCLGCSVLWLDILLQGEDRGWECLHDCMGRRVLPLRVVFCSGKADLHSPEYERLAGVLEAQNVEVRVLLKPVLSDAIRRAVEG